MGISLAGHHAYVADSGAGLQVIDISNPANPQRTSGFSPTAGAGGVAVAGKFIYVADSAAVLILYHATRIHIEPIGMGQSIFRTRVFGPEGAPAQFQYSANLTDWFDFGAPVVFKIGRGVMSDLDSHQYPQRFYRAALRCNMQRKHNADDAGVTGEVAFYRDCSNARSRSDSEAGPRTG